MEYKIKRDLADYVPEILRREQTKGVFEECSIERVDDGDYVLRIEMPEKYILTVLEEAEGLKDMLENNRKTPRYGERILADPDYFRRCREYYKTPCFRQKI